MQKTIRRSLHIVASPQEVSALIENVDRTPEWNPLVKEVRQPKESSGQDIRWKASIAGLTISGYSKPKTWVPGKEYSWSNFDQGTGLGLDSRFIVKPVKNGTNLTAVVSFKVPTRLPSKLLTIGAGKVLEKSIDTSLKNIRKIVTARR